MAVGYIVQLSETIVLESFAFRNNQVELIPAQAGILSL
jgi:hypothetical protein